MSDTYKILMTRMEKYTRKIQTVRHSYYVCIPKPLIDGFGKRKGNKLEFRKALDESNGKIIIILDINGE